MVWCHWLLQRSESFGNRGAFKLGPASNFCMFDFRGCFLYLPGYHPVLGNLSQIVTNNSVFVPRTLKKNIYIYIRIYTVYILGVQCFYLRHPIWHRWPTSWPSQRFRMRALWQRCRWPSLFCSCCVLPFGAAWMATAVFGCGWKCGYQWIGLRENLNRKRRKP